MNNFPAALRIILLGFVWLVAIGGECDKEGLIVPCEGDKDVTFSVTTDGKCDIEYITNNAFEPTRSLKNVGGFTGTQTFPCGETVWVDAVSLGADTVTVKIIADNEVVKEKSGLNVHVEWKVQFVATN